MFASGFAFLKCSNVSDATEKVHLKITQVISMTYTCHVLSSHDVKLSRSKYSYTVFELASVVESRTADSAQARDCLSQFCTTT